MRKNVYTRKPRKPSKALRKLFEVEIKHKINNLDNNNPKLSKTQIEDIKLKIRKKLRRENIIDRMLLILTCIIVFLSFWYFIK